MRAELTPDVIDYLAFTIHQENIVAGWYNDPKTGEWKPKTTQEFLALTHSEISEALEGWRKDLKDKHLTHRDEFTVELADAVIRLLDFASYRRFDMKSVDVEDMVKIKTSSIPELICELHWIISAMYDADQDGKLNRNEGGWWVIAFIDCLLDWVESDFWDVVQEKRDYNKNRADHKKEARNAEGGKKI